MKRRYRQLHHDIEHSFNDATPGCRYAQEEQPNGRFRTKRDVTVRTAEYAEAGYRIEGD